MANIVAGMTIGNAMRAAARALSNSPTPMLDARILLMQSTRLTETELIIRDGAMIDKNQAEDFLAYIERRKNGEPIAYLTGKKEFWSLTFDVSPDVLIPREDSECLIEAALARRASTERLAILDLGTGSGCLLCALLRAFKTSEAIGVDQSSNAISVAEKNAERLGFSDRASFRQSDWFSGVTGEFDLIIANPPYIAEEKRETLPVDVAAYEPGSALFAGAGGLDAFRAILGDAPSHLSKDGLIIFEMGSDQAEELAAMVTKSFPEAETGLIYDLQRRPRGIFADRRRGAKKD